MRWLLAGAGLAACLGLGPALAQEPVSFQGKTVTMIIGFAPGGGTDQFGRAVARFWGKHLPGNPAIVPKNVPGAEGVTAMNFVVQQSAPDGLTVSTSANTSVDPANYRNPGVHYVPTDFEFVGGGGRGGQVLLIAADKEKRLYDRSAAPLIMGSLGGVPRSGMQITAWGIELLGWNAKWVTGYPGTTEVMLALERGEIDMTATGNLNLIQKLLETKKFKILIQSAGLKDGKLVGRPEFGAAQLLENVVEGKLGIDVVKQAFAYWSTMNVTDKWIALPPKTPKPIVEAYRVAYDKLMQDGEFMAAALKISEDFTPLNAAEIDRQLRLLHSMSPEAVGYMKTILRKQGLNVP